MAEDKPDNSDSDFARIEPAAINLTARLPEEPAPGTAVKLKRSPVIWLGLGALLMAAVVVIFLLPSWVNTDADDPGELARAPASTTETTVKPATPSREKLSPWEKAQESSLRKETQDILSQMLEAQRALADRGVEIWAAEDYAKAMQLAQQGDEFYNERDFLKSKEEYEKGLSIFSRLVEDMDVIFQNTMEKGNKALEDGDSALAREAFTLALAIDAIDRAAISGMERAEKLDEVLAIMNDGKVSLDKGELESAKEFYASALALDDRHQAAKQQIELVDKLILDREFASYMSAGFSALDKKQYEKARKSFNGALKLKSRSVEARNALEQTRHQLTTININSLISRASKFENEENWHEALASYKAALKIDPNLAQAQKGEQYASLRSKLHDRLEQILSQPSRLYDEKVYRETRAFKAKLVALSNQGPLLGKQLAGLDTLLARAETPINVVIQSDNLTRVVLRKVSELGYFHEKTLSIKPGKYVLVGIRDGYRDVRVEFFLDPDKSLGPISVQAAEKIALGR